MSDSQFRGPDETLGFFVVWLVFNEEGRKVEDNIPLTPH
jgi:hypothetical protein